MEGDLLLRHVSSFISFVVTVPSYRPRLRVRANECVDELSGIERSQVVGALTEADELHRDAQFPLHGDDDPALSPELAPPPTAPVFLLHGRDDNIIPAAESVLLGNRLRADGVATRVLLSGLLTHASVNPAASARDAWELVRFWADVLRQ